MTTVTKHRQTFQLDWQGRSFEIALDNVDGLGQYVELELMAEKSEIAAAQEAVRSLAEEFGLRESERRSYLELLLAAGGG